MPYPDVIDKFVEKLNRKQDGVYVIEEELTITDGVFEGFLAHDNINIKNIQIYTGSKLIGEKIENYFISTPSETPWKLNIKIFAVGFEKVYVTYETSGDTVEADDVNVLQTSVTATQVEIERYKTVGIIDGGDFNRGEE